MSIDDLSASKAELRTLSANHLGVTLEGVSASDLLACMEPKLLDALLDEIGADKCINHFNLELTEEE